MRTKVQRWGNSLAIRIPKSFAEEVGLKNDSPVELRLVEGALVVKPAQSRPQSLKELLAGVTDSNIHGEVEEGPPQGTEVW
jgi:antitoxin MazE